MLKKKQQNQNEKLFVKNNRIAILTFLLLFFTLNGIASNYVAFKPQIVSIQKKNIQLQLDEAHQQLTKQQLSDSKNSAIAYLRHVNGYLRYFVTEDNRDYEQYKTSENTALLHFDKLLDSSPFKGFFKSDVYLYAATLDLRNGNFYEAAKSLRKSWNLIEENHKRFPHFKPNNKIRGILRIYLSAIPENYSWMTNLMGFDGDLNIGIALLKQLSDFKTDTTYLGVLAQESSYILANSMMQIQKHPHHAWLEMLKCTQDYKTNLLSNYFRSTMALKLNKNDIALKTLTSIPTSSSYISFPTMSYYAGLAKLYKGDPNAIYDFKFFLENYKGKHLIKSCYEKMSWHSLLSNDFEEAQHYKNEIGRYGTLIMEEDKQAQRYLRKQLPDPIILKARLLFDGGYYQSAYNTIIQTKVKALSTMDKKSEYCYRKGRILDRLGHQEQALVFYEASTIYGKKSKEYYGPYACIFMGDIYLKQGKRTLAKQFYTRATTYSNNQEYIQTIEQRAKSGLKQLK